jgi:2,3-bisphosphoglycerate-independent phosphoglycerate mutase
MKYVVVIMDGAAGRPLADRGGKTCLQFAHKPNLDRLAKEGTVGLARTVPPGMEPGSAVACMSVLGYDPSIYYRGRSAIEAKSLGLPLSPGDVTFRCNLISVRGDGRLASYSAGNITSADSHLLMASLREKLDNDRVHFYPGVDYRHIAVIKGGSALLQAECTPPHDIPGQPVANYLPKGAGSDLLRDLMERSKPVLKGHPTNQSRKLEGKLEATQIWLFWGSGEVPDLPLFSKRYGLKAALTSAVDLLNGLAKMGGLTPLAIKGVTAGPDNDYAAQAAGAIRALDSHDLVVVHVESPDEAGHGGEVDAKIYAIEQIDHHIIGALLGLKMPLCLLVMPDHPTPIATRTHNADPVPFLMWGPGFPHSGASVWDESSAAATGAVFMQGHLIMDRFTGRSR